MTFEWIGLLCSYLYAGGLLVGAEVLHRRYAVPTDITRKIVHVSAGMWIFAVLWFFNTWQMGIIPFATFIGLN